MKPSQWDFFSAIAKVLLKKFHLLDPQPSEVIGNFPIVCYRLGLRLSCVSKIVIKYFRIEYKNLVWESSLKKWRFDWTDQFKNENIFEYNLKYPRSSWGRNFHEKKGREQAPWLWEFTMLLDSGSGPGNIVLTHGGPTLRQNWAQSLPCHERDCKVCFIES